MKFYLGSQQLRDLSRSQEACFLLTNGLGGYASLTSACSVNRCDQGVLIAAVKAPNVRRTLVHRLCEELTGGEQTAFLSTQAFADGTKAEEGYRYLQSFTYEYTPCWQYLVNGIRVTRQLAMAYEENTTAVLYRIENPTSQPCTLRVSPFVKFAPKEQAVSRRKAITLRGNSICGKDTQVDIITNMTLLPKAQTAQRLAYPEDAADGRPAKGLCFCCCAAEITVPAGTSAEAELIFTDCGSTQTAQEILHSQNTRLAALANQSGFQNEIARQLAVSADAYISRRESTGGKTILAGYPLFSDWGRDTMIALPGLTLSAKRYDDAASILRTFLAYEHNGLVPNLFPEGGCEPMYNTADAALLLIDTVWQYYTRTQDADFVREAWPVLTRIIAAYRNGTDHAIYMDTDALIHAGDGMDQVTWMDVCVQGILPTPRHGKPVEINAYWYNALCIMDRFSALLGIADTDYAALAQKVKASFVSKFYMEDRGYLKDVLSGTDADTQLRCNQVWALSLPFTMLSREQELRVLGSIEQNLLTPCGLRTLAMDDPQFRGFYGGKQLERDLAYHQGTVWVFPMGAYYRALLRLRGDKAAVRSQLSALIPMLAEGCLGQLPEIYDGAFPTKGKGCFAQAWSVGELLRVFEALEA